MPQTADDFGKAAMIAKARREMRSDPRYCIVSAGEHMVVDLHGEAATEEFDSFREAAARARALNGRVWP